ncbi:MAG: N-acetyl-gamma-glutamyl-phosphate reductase [Christensenellaceae bacterium]|nr:N-acetyl-gamma-glutamyl-phosphate reductase [Christensenellaceae bacterium]
MTSVFIDGKGGTTGLRIFERLESRDDVSVITLAEEDRKDPKKRAEALNSCEIAFLCLPDAAAKEAALMVTNPKVKIIDASTAHRTAGGWVYGLPELSKEQYEKIYASNRIANPGCHASGFIALIAPLVKAGILSKDILLTATSITGYSGGGKKMIAQYEAKDRDPLLSYPRPYALTMNHKHLKEMKALCGLETSPAFVPVVADFYSGMCVTVPLFKNDINGSKEDIEKLYADHYISDIVKYVADAGESGFASAGILSGKDSMEISVHGNDDTVLLMARYDNLGKGACGAALECMNILMGKAPEYSLMI